MKADAKSLLTCTHLLLAAGLAGCALLAPPSFAPGSTVAAVVAGMGVPTAEYTLPQGGKRLEYATGPFGKSTRMFSFADTGLLLGAEEVLTEHNFMAIQAGMSADEVLRRIGKPSTVWGIPRQHQNVWSYRYESFFCQWFMVGMGYDDVVVDTAYGPDPVCDVLR